MRSAIRLALEGEGLWPRTRPSEECESLVVREELQKRYRFDIRKFTDTHKWCRGCEQMLERDRFGKHAGKPSGLTIYCKSCEKERRAMKRKRTVD